MYNVISAILWQAPIASTLGTVEGKPESRRVSVKAERLPRDGTIKLTPECVDHKEDVMKKYMIEREIPKIGALEREKLQEAAAKSNQVLRQLGPEIQWLESFITADKMFCMYLANDEAIIRRHAELSGFPATRITEIRKMVDPTTAAHP